VFACDIDPAISANPYFEFNAKVPESGTFVFTWVDDDGSEYTTDASIEIE
jgi:sulfur-oxidizing protein SoxZ